MEASGSAGTTGGATAGRSGGPATTWRGDGLEIRPRRLEIRREGGSHRIEPKAMAVLLHLLARRGEVATRDEILAAVWDDVRVGEDVLTRAIGLLRKALDDDPGDPRFVETIRGSGYRWRWENAPLVEEGPASRSVTPDVDRARPGPASARPGRGLREWPTPAVVVALLALAGLAVAVVLSLDGTPTEGGRAAEGDPAASAPGSLGGREPAPGDARGAARLAIMPFELAVEDRAVAAGLSLVSERLLAELGGDRTLALEVVGPRSTHSFSSFPFPDLEAMERDLGVDYVLNARLVVPDEGEPRLLVELIRLADGAHPWVEMFPVDGDWDALAERVLQGVAPRFAARTSVPDGGDG